MADQLQRLKVALADRYQIERKIGSGGMATVYLAADLKHERNVAVKVLRPEVAASLGSKRFHQEIKIVANLIHPHVLPLLDSGEAGGFCYYVMPYVDGESLRDRLRREKQLPIEDAVKTASEVAAALDFAHRHEVVHRDIKPENILLEGGVAVVADFGIAKAVDAAGGERLTETGIAIGTPAYVSPEQGTGESDIDGRSDIYSLGCVLFEMLAGEPPFTGLTSQSIVARHVGERPPSLRVVRPAVPRALEEVIERTLEKVPVDRFKTAAEFGAALHRAVRASVGIRREKVRKLVRVALLIPLVVGAMWLVPRLVETDISHDPSRVAVLYFEDLTRAHTLGHVAMGLTEELIDELGAIEALHVVSSAGMRPYRGRDVSLDSIVSSFEVGTLVHGSVDSSAGIVRVTVRLIDGGTFAQLGSESFEERWAEVPEMGRRLATEVSRFLRRRLGEAIRLRQQRAETGGIAAWDLVRRGEVLREDATIVERSGDLATAFRLYLRADSMLAVAETEDPEWIEPTLLRGWLMWRLGRVAERMNLRSSAQGVSEHVPGMSYWICEGLVHSAASARRLASETETTLSGGI